MRVSKTDRTGEAKPLKMGTRAVASAGDVLEARSGDPRREAVGWARRDGLRTNYVLIDFESVQPKSLSLLAAEHFRIHVFIGPASSTLPSNVVLPLHEFRSRADYVRLETAGRNALDFHLAFYLGKLVSADPSGFFHIISRDKGFDPLVRHLKGKNIFSARSESIEDMPCFRQHPAEPDGESGASGPKGIAEPVCAVTMDDLLKLVIDDLTKRKAGKPKTLEALKSTVQARCGKHASAAAVDALYTALVTRGYVKVDGDRLQYALPTA
jgi:hypothetical protein